MRSRKKGTLFWSCNSRFCSFSFFQWFCCLLIISTCTGVSMHELITHPVPVMPTVWPASFGNSTIGPSSKVNYSLRVTTSGPAVVDSVIHFTAQVFSSPNDTTSDEKFIFLWHNNADHSTNQCEDLHHTVLNKSFQQGKAGEYVMIVVVSPFQQPRNILAFTSIGFRLTKHLNGHLKVKQALEYQRNNLTFAVDRPLHFQVDITDHFNETDSPQFTYFWYNGSKLIHETSTPYYEKNFSRPDVLHLQAVASVVFASDPYARRSTIPDKSGSFKEKLMFKESLTACNMTRVDGIAEDQSIKIGSTLVLNITCNGSSPSAVCWNLTNLNTTMNETCKPPSEDFPNTTHHQVKVSINTKGWSTLHLAIYNDVSYYRISQNYYVYGGDTVNIPALVFPLAFITIGAIIAIIGGTYIVRLRRKLHVEVADFDFSPAISAKSKHRLSSAVTAVKHFFLRFKHSRQSTTDEFQRFSYRNNLYESL